METKQAYPLQWPVGWKRTAERKNGQFSKRETNYSTGLDGKRQSWTSKRYLKVSDGVGRILESLERMGIDRNDVVISTNVPVRLDGLPRSGEREPDDPGAAVYWRDGEMRCMAIDRYTTVADNLAAIAATLEAMRAIERHGGAEILERTFTGFAALPEKTTQPWRDMLGLSGNAGREDVESAFRAMARIHHPDAGGDRERFEAIVQARIDALKELGI